MKSEVGRSSERYERVGRLRMRRQGRHRESGDFGDADCPKAEPADRPASGSSRRPTGTRWSSPARTARPGSRFKAPTALSEYRITARGVTGADTLAGQTTASLDGPQELLRRPQGPGSLTQGDKPRFIAQVHHTGVAGKLALRLAIYAGGRDEVYPKTLELKRRRRRGPVRAVRGPRRRLGPPDAHGHVGDVERRADGRGADPSLGRAGVRLGLGHEQREHDRLRRAFRRAGRYESPEMLIVVVADAASACSSSWPSATTPFRYCERSRANAARA